MSNPLDFVSRIRWRHSKRGFSHAFKVIDVVANEGDLISPQFVLGEPLAESIKFVSESRDTVQAELAATDFGDGILLGRKHYEFQVRGFPQHFDTFTIGTAYDDGLLP